MAIEDLTVLLNGAQKALVSDDIGAVGRYVLLQKIVSAQPDSLAALDKLIGQAYSGNDPGFPFLAVVNDHKAGLAGVADGEYGAPLLTPRGLLHTYASGERKVLRDEFSGVNGSAPDVTKWTIARQQGAGSATLNGSSQLLLQTGGVTSGDGVEVVSTDTYQAPMRLIVTLTAISQRIANQEFSIELIEENTAADTAGTDSVKVLFNGTVNTTSQVTTYSQGDQNPVVNWTTLATSGVVKFEIDLMTDEVWFYDATADSTSQRSGYAHLDRKAPDPTKRYRVRLRLKNTAAAASNTTVQIDSVVIEDNAYLPVELAHSRGSAIGGEALPVALSASVMGISNVLGGVGALTIWTDDTSAVLGAAATFTGTYRDMIGTTTGGTATTKPGMLRIISIADVAGTLYIEASPDNGTTNYRIGGQALTQTPDTTARFTATIQQPVVMRYHRPVLVNGASVQTVHRTNTVQLSLPGT